MECLVRFKLFGKQDPQWSRVSHAGCSLGLHRPQSVQGKGWKMPSTSPELDRIRSQIVSDPENAWATAVHYEPIYVADPAARIVVIGQAPGRRAQESGVPWNDASGARLIRWLGVDDATFRDPRLFALLPMDFY